MEKVSNDKDSKTDEPWNHTSMVKAVSSLLNEIISENKSELLKNKDKNYAPKNIFTSKKPPSISVLSYFDRIIKYTKIEESTLIITLIYIDRLCDLSQLLLSDFNIHRVILAAVVLAIKYNEDDYYSNEYYAKVGGVSLQEINKVELEGVLGLKHSLFINDDFFNKYKIYLKHYLK